MTEMGPGCNNSFMAVQILTIYRRKKERKKGRLLTINFDMIRKFDVNLINRLKFGIIEFGLFLSLSV